jgi:hypothetical protein
MRRRRVGGDNGYAHLLEVLHSLLASVVRDDHLGHNRLGLDETADVLDHLHLVLDTGLQQPNGSGSEHTRHKEYKETSAHLSSRYSSRGEKAAPYNVMSTVSKKCCTSSMFTKYTSLAT